MFKFYHFTIIDIHVVNSTTQILNAFMELAGCYCWCKFNFLLVGRCPSSKYFTVCLKKISISNDVHNDSEEHCGTSGGSAGNFKFCYFILIWWETDKKPRNPEAELQGAVYLDRTIKCLINYRM